MIATLVVLSLFAPITAPQSIKLNRPLVTTPRPTAGILTPVASPDGRYLVYPIDRDGDGEFELVSVAVDDDAGPTHLSEFSLLGGYWADQPEITADGKRVLFVGFLDADDTLDLAMVPIDGSAAPLDLDGAASARLVEEFELSHDGVHAVYLAEDALATYELFSVAVDGSAAPVKLSGSLVAGGDVIESAHTGAFALSDDGALVLYTADALVDDLVELFVTPVDGSAPPRKLPIPLVPGGDVTAFAFAQGGTVAVYTADQDEDERFELFAVALDGASAPRKLSGILVPGGDVGANTFGSSDYIPTGGGGFTVSADGAAVVYFADQELDERIDLYGVPVDGSRAAMRLSSATDEQVVLSQLSHDSHWAVYRARVGIWSVPIDGSVPSRRLDGPLVPGGAAAWPMITLDDQRVVYSADQDTNDVTELYSAPIDGSAPAVKLNAPLPAGGFVEGDGNFPGFFTVSGGVVYAARQTHPAVADLFFVPATGGTPPRKLDEGPVLLQFPPASSPDRIVFFTAAALKSVGLLPDAKPVEHDALPREVGAVRESDLDLAGERVVYQASEEGEGPTPRLDCVRTRERLERVEVMLADARALDLVRVVPDGSRVLFTATLWSSGTTGLYSAPLDGGAPPARLDPATGDIAVHGLTPDGSMVVFSSISPDTVQQLFSALVDGSAPATLLAVANNGIGTVEFSADGQRIAYLDYPRLHAVPVDGSAPAVLVSGSVQALVGDFELAGPQGAAVVFRAGFERSELYFAPTTGGTAPRRVSARQQPGTSVLSFALTPDGSRAVYLADDRLNETFELSSVPLDGSAPAVRLHPELTAGRDVVEFQISPDGRQVVYRADALENELIELFRSPIDASRPPVRLDRIHVAGGDVRDFRITADSKRVVYRADESADELVELFSVPIRGSRFGGTRLSRPLVPGGDVTSFQLSADGRIAVFTAERDAAGARTLLSAPVSGLEKATEIAGPFQGGGSVGAFRVGADGRVVVYDADQDEAGVVELYSVRH